MISRIISGALLFCVAVASQHPPPAEKRTTLPGFDRNAFTFTDYFLSIEMRPEQKDLRARGTVTLRNDSQAPQRAVALQISSTLKWTSLGLAGEVLRFAASELRSDIDHTGAVNEAVIQLPQPVAPGGSVTLTLAYSGTIPHVSRRLTELGTPEEIALRTDWDRISPGFTAVRGVGYVAWYPVAIEPALLSEGNEVFRRVNEWKARNGRARFEATILVFGERGSRSVVVGTTEVQPAGVAGAAPGTGTERPLASTTLWLAGHEAAVPAFAVADFHQQGSVYSLGRAERGVHTWQAAVARLTPMIREWFGREPAATFVQLASDESSPWESGRLLFTPMPDRASPAAVEGAVAHALTHSVLRSARPWISEGVPHLMQARLREQAGGRRAALAYMGERRAALTLAEPAPAQVLAGSARGESLVTAVDDIYFRTKAMYVWWMLRDLVGEPVLRGALAKYRAELDREPSYIQRLLETESQRDLEWFFSDWVYRGRGLPEFRIASVHARKALTGGFLITVAVENRGAAGAEVPVTVRTRAGEMTRRLLVPANSTSSIRISVPAEASEAVVNDGSVPETNLNDNTAPVGASAGSQ